MTAEIIDGTRIAGELRREVAEETRRFTMRTGVRPGLAFLLVGENAASRAYVRMKGKGCEEVGFVSVTEEYPADTPPEHLLRRIHELNADSSIHGILVQLPLPKGFDEQIILESIDPAKDVDGLHPFNIGRLVLGLPTIRSCTPAGIQELLVRSGHDPKGRHVVVVGRSNIVGKPVANILLQKQSGANAVVTIAHTGASDISRYTTQADILIAAIGRPKAVTGSMIKPGAVVIDVGINRVEDPTARNGYRIVGDVDFASASQVAGAISPVPGGVGPMTIAMLLKNTLQAAVAQTADTAAAL